MKRLLVLLFMVLAFPAQSTVNSSTNKTIVLGNNSQTTFTFNFIGVSAAYIGVLLTDSAGTQTALTQGAGATQFQVTLNAAVQGAIWGIGGTVTYNPSGTPIPAGSTLTIYRTLPLTQAITLQNMASIAVLGKGAEIGLDTGVMQGQQINEVSSRAIVANIANSAAPLPLPPAAQLANQGLCGDSTGFNIVGCSLPSIGVISTAMQPVVNAASLALGRAAFGLGSMAVENINGGSCGGPSIQDDGSAGGTNGVGYARVMLTTVSDSTNQAVTCNFHLTQRIATGPITYTLARANTLFAGWAMKVYVASGLITFAPNAADKFPGVSSGNSVAVSSGSVCTVTTDAATSGNWQIDCNTSPPTLSASVGTNALTITLNSSLIDFRSTTLAQGSPSWAIPTANLSITVPSTATLGTSNGVPFRGWIFAAYNSGTPILGVATCSNASTVFSCTAWETQRKSGTTISTGATAGGALYTTSTVTTDSIRIIGYFEYSGGLATAGAWASVPTTLQVCMPPYVCKRPGDTVQVVRSSTGAVATGTGTFTTNDTIPTTGNGDQYMSQAITPTSPANILKIDSLFNGANNAGNVAFTTALFQDATSNALAATWFAANSAAQTQVSLSYYMVANTAISTTFKIRAGGTSGTTTFNGAAGARVYGGVMQSYLKIEEIMG